MVGAVVGSLALPQPRMSNHPACLRFCGLVAGRRQQRRGLETPRRAMKLELLYFEGCPGGEELVPRLWALAAAHGAEVDVRRIESPEAAVAERFLGSPTVRVDGEDVEAGVGERTDYGLKCRLYRSAQGHARTPPDEWITDALARTRWAGGSL